VGQLVCDLQQVRSTPFFGTIFRWNAIICQDRSDVRNTEQKSVSNFSDHGYSLGQYRLPTHKMQVYENTLRVPFFIRGPGIEAGLQLPIISGFVDLCPTIVQLASGLAPSDTDGRSFVRKTPARPAPTCWQPEINLLWDRLTVVD
jgi:hypothetical protein